MGVVGSSRISKGKLVLGKGDEEQVKLEGRGCRTWNWKR
jgi:hypothetical protein